MDRTSALETPEKKGLVRKVLESSENSEFVVYFLHNVGFWKYTKDPEAPLVQFFVGIWHEIGETEGNTLKVKINKSQT